MSEITKLYYRQHEVAKEVGVRAQLIAEWDVTFNLVLGTTQGKRPLYTAEHIVFFKAVSKLRKLISMGVIKLMAKGKLGMKINGKDVFLPKVRMWR
jgi:MerR-like DNA binding protein